MRVIYMQFSGAKKHVKHAASSVLYVGGVALVAGTLLACSQQMQPYLHTFGRMLTTHTRPRKLALYCHHVFNGDTAQNLEQQAVQNIAKVSIARLDPQQLFTQLQEQFPVVERVSWHMPRPLFAEMHVYGTMPMWRLGDDRVIGANNVVYPASQFATYDL